MDGNTYQVDLTQSIHQMDPATKFRRGLWEYFGKPLYRLIPGKRNRLRILLLRAFGARIGHRCTLLPRIDILIPWMLEIGDDVAISHDVTILNFVYVQIGSMTVISQGVHLCTGTHDYTHPHFPLVKKPVHIGAEVWIASGSFIAPGCTIGRGSVIGANSVVTKDMPEWQVCAGNPCHAIKARDIQPQEDR